MKTPALLKKAIVPAILIAGLNITTSCDSCSRKDKTDDASTYNEGSETADTTSVTVTDSTTATSTATYRSGNAAGTNGTAAGGKGTNNGTSKGEALTEEEITNRIENSSSTATDAQGRPINSGG